MAIWATGACRYGKVLSLIATLNHAPGRPRTKTASVTRKYTRPRKATSTTLERKRTLASIRVPAWYTSLVVTAASVGNVTQVDKLLHGVEGGGALIRFIPGARSVKNSQMSWSRPAAALTRNTASALPCTRRSAGSRKLRPVCGQRSSVHPWQTSMQ